MAPLTESVSRRRYLSMLDILASGTEADKTRLIRRNTSLPHGVLLALAQDENEEVKIHLAMAAKGLDAIGHGLRLPDDILWLLLKDPCSSIQANLSVGNCNLEMLHYLSQRYPAKYDVTGSDARCAIKCYTDRLSNFAGIPIEEGIVPGEFTDALSKLELLDIIASGTVRERRDLAYWHRNLLPDIQLALAQDENDSIRGDLLIGNSSKKLHRNVLMLLAKDSALYIRMRAKRLLNLD